MRFVYVYRVKIICYRVNCIGGVLLLEQLISANLYREMQLLPAHILKDSALEMRRLWIKNPDDLYLLAGLLIFIEVMKERNIVLPEMQEDELAVIRCSFLIEEW
jgi:hypothetical protein